MSIRYKQHRRMRRRATHGCGARFARYVKHNHQLAWSECDSEYYKFNCGKDIWYIPLSKLPQT